MRRPRIYTPLPLTCGQVVELDEAPSRHLAKVLRLQRGREVILFNGQGGEYRATLKDIGKKTVTAAVFDFSDKDRESPLRVELAIGISRGERMDWVVQKATELGVTALTPLFTERTEVKLDGPRLEKKLQHWQQIVINACEQCQRNRLPQLFRPAGLGEWMAGARADSKLVLHPATEAPNLNLLPPPQSVILLIGSEGGFSDAEITGARERGFIPLTLGPRILRTETAPLTALGILQHLWGDL